MHAIAVLATFALSLLGSAVRAQDCGAAVDFLALPLPLGGNAVETAMEAAYPGLDVDLAGPRVILADGRVQSAQSARAIAESDRVSGTTFGDQSVPTYPLSFDLGSRQAPWFDPGRARDEALMRALWFDREDVARASLARVAYAGASVTAEFLVSTQHCAHVQAAAALDDIASMGPEMDPFFRDAAGSFAWRPIAGTDRLSMHAYIAAIDLNAELGGYWRWSGAAEGNVGEYANQMPAALVRAMERRGFICGGKWHHYDGMHFEYRPELILHARLSGT